MNTHLGIEQSRRDDLESLGFMLLYFLRGSLPWQGLRAATKKQKYEKICFSKLSISVDQLCAGQPDEFITYFQYVRGLRFDDKPDYTYLRRLLRDLFVQRAYTWDYVFDWTVLKYQLLQNETTAAKNVVAAGAAQSESAATGGAVDSRPVEGAVDELSPGVEAVGDDATGEDVTPVDGAGKDDGRGAATGATDGGAEGEKNMRSWGQKAHALFVRYPK